MTDASDIDPPEMPVAFDEQGRPVPVSHPVYDPGEAEQIDQPRADASSILAEFLRTMTKGRTANQAGQALHILAFWAGVHEAETNRALAAALKVSPGRITQIMAVIAGDFPSLARLKSRTAKARPIGDGQFFDEPL
jgi:hypothetical protein